MVDEKWKRNPSVITADDEFVERWFHDDGNCSNLEVYIRHFAS